MKKEPFTLELVKKKILKNKSLIIFLTLAIAGWNLFRPLPENFKLPVIIFVFISLFLISKEEPKTIIKKEPESGSPFNWIPEET